MLRRLPLLLLALVFALTAVVQAQDTTTKKPKIRRDPDLISAEEIEAADADAQSAFELVTRLRPLWLNKRDIGSMAMAAAEIQIYVNDVKSPGGPPALKAIPRATIKEIRHLRGTDASQRFGTNHENGAILVTTK